MDSREVTAASGADGDGSLCSFAMSVFVSSTATEGTSCTTGFSSSEAASVVESIGFDSSTVGGIFTSSAKWEGGCGCAAGGAGTGRRAAALRGIGGGAGDPERRGFGVGEFGRDVGLVSPPAMIAESGRGFVGDEGTESGNGISEGSVTAWGRTRIVGTSDEAVGAAGNSVSVSVAAGSLWELDDPSWLFDVVFASRTSLRDGSGGGGTRLGTLGSAATEGDTFISGGCCSSEGGVLLPVAFVESLLSALNPVPHKLVTLSDILRRGVGGGGGRISFGPGAPERRSSQTCSMTLLRTNAHNEHVVRSRVRHQPDAQRGWGAKALLGNALGLPWLGGTVKRKIWTLETGGLGSVAGGVLGGVE